MNDSLTNGDQRPWYRQVWPWLLMLPPAVSVVGGVTMVWLATQTPSALVVDDYARIEELTAARFAKDEFAAVNGISATARLERNHPQATSVAIDLVPAAASVPPDFLVLHFRHAIAEGLDRTINAWRDGDAYRCLVDLGDGFYVLEIEPPDARWRLAARLRSSDELIELRAGAQGE